MKTKNKNRTFEKEGLSFGNYSLFFGWLLFAVCLFAAEVAAETVQGELNPICLIESFIGSEPKEKSYPLPIEEKTPTRIGRQLWQVKTIENPEDIKNNESKKQLQQKIEQIRSVKLESRDIQPKAFIVVEPIQKTKPNETFIHAEVKQHTPGQEIEPKLKPSPDTEKQNEGQMSSLFISDKTLQVLTDVSENPEQLENPFELAEVLFNCGRLKEAAKCYQIALGRITSDQTEVTLNKAWILFQLGNCLRNDAPPKAIKFYRQLIAEYPDSPWSGLAKARSRLIIWYQQAKPRTLIEENQF